MVTKRKKVQVRGGRILDSGTGRCDNTSPLLTTITHAYEEVAGMHPSIPSSTVKGPGESRIGCIR